MGGTLFVGDLHCKQKMVLPLIDNVVKDNEVDTIVFLGDYVDDWYSTDSYVIDSLNEHIKWYKKACKKLNIVNLCGNHDWCYLFKSHNVSSGHHYNIEEQVRLLLKKLNITMSYSFTSRGKDYLVTHSGVTSSWLNEVKYDRMLSSEDICRFLNKCFHSKDEKLNYCGPTRKGTDEVSGPLWTDAREFEYNKNSVGIDFNQIVGHTPVQRITYEVCNNGNSVVTFCDTLSGSYTCKDKPTGKLLLMNSEGFFSNVLITEYYSYMLEEYYSYLQNMKIDEYLSSLHMYGGNV